MSRYVLVIVLFLASACHRTETKTPEMVRLETLRAQVTVVEKQLAEIEEKMKGSSNDFGLQSQLRNDRELARSRLLRIKAALGETPAKKGVPGHH